jgi:hypothetical protein
LPRRPRSQAVQTETTPSSMETEQSLTSASLCAPYLWAPGKFFGLSGECCLAQELFKRPKLYGFRKKKGRAVDPAFLLISKVSMFIKNRLRHHEASPLLTTSAINAASPVNTQHSRLSLSSVNATSPLYPASSFFTTSAINTASSFLAGSSFRNILLMGNESSLNSRTPPTLVHSLPHLNRAAAYSQQVYLTFSVS